MALVEHALVLHNAGPSSRMRGGAAGGVGAMASRVVSRFVRTHAAWGACDVLECAARRIAAADVLAQLYEFCLHAYFAVGGCTAWTPPMQAMSIPEIDRAEFVGHCLARGCCLTLACCARKTFDHIQRHEDTFHRCMELASQLARWISSVSLVKGMEHHNVLLWSLFLCVLHRARSHMAALHHDDEGNRRGELIACLNRVLDHLHRLSSSSSSGRFMAVLRSIKSESDDALPVKFQFATQAFLVYSLCGAGSRAVGDKAVKAATSALERLPIRSSAFDTPEFRNCYVKVIEVVRSKETHSDTFVDYSECHELCHTLMSRIYPEAKCFVSWG